MSQRQQSNDDTHCHHCRHHDHVVDDPRPASELTILCCHGREEREEKDGNLNGTSSHHCHNESEGEGMMRLCCLWWGHHHFHLSASVCCRRMEGSGKGEGKGIIIRA